MHRQDRTFTLGGEIDDIKCRKQRYVDVDFTTNPETIEYVPPLQDPYKKATEYFAKHGINELFGVCGLLSICIHYLSNIK